MVRLLPLRDAGAVLCGVVLSARQRHRRFALRIGNGWFGGLLPLVATAMVATAGNIYFGLWYPIVVAVMTVVIGLIFLRNTKDANLEAD